MSGIIATTLDADGVLLATIDMTDRTMNVFSVELMDALDALMDRAERDDAVRSVVIASGKPTFLAGADLVMVRGYTQAARRADHATMFEMCGRLGRQFVRLEASAKPWVAAVNGIALGGGLELALACRVRLVADDPRIQLGVPEVRWGLLPGAGGTQRLPRLAGCEPALDLLLSGRSVDPATAVSLGIFARAVPAEALLKEAKAIARSLRDTPCNIAAKFPHLAQAEVPAWSEGAAREAARRHGIDDETFAHYPAYSAIVDAVLKGARRPLAEATDVEMEQFLRLMFSPIAGRMVSTLFLERLRAERELAPPAGTALERVANGVIGAANGAWSEALMRTRLPLSADAALPADTLELVGRDGTHLHMRLATPTTPTGAGNANARDPSATDPEGGHSIPLAVLSPAGPYGRVLECVGTDATAQTLAAALAARLRAIAWRTPGPASILQALHGQPLKRQAALAVAAAAANGAGDPAFLDTAACLAGVTPAWSGGPLTWAWTEREALAPTFDAPTRAAWQRLEPALARAFH
jgi:3-hydroxyacyl-CoA dehydrogenase/enoyl-CoA hydratase/3-hydroxybutyryl-CoA epimerase